MWGHSGGRRRRAERGTTPVRSEKRRPAQQVDSQVGKQKAVGGDPADGLQHVQGLDTNSRAAMGAVNVANAAHMLSACL